MASSSNQTTDHDTIRRWAESRGGKPARVRGTGNKGGGLLRIEFQDPDDSLEPISWEEFFEQFDDADLAFLYQEEKEGSESRFHKFVAREGKK